MALPQATLLSWQHSQPSEYWPSMSKQVELHDTIWQFPPGPEQSVLVVFA
jgi:hypothetical protein